MSMTVVMLSILCVVLYVLGAACMWALNEAIGFPMEGSVFISACWPIAAVVILYVLLFVPDYREGPR